MGAAYFGQFGKVDPAGMTASKLQQAVLYTPNVMLVSPFVGMAAWRVQKTFQRKQQENLANEER